MLPELTIHRGHVFPVRRQIELHIESQILAGALPNGARLPSVRRLAGRLHVHRNTVAAAYAELSRVGLVTPRHGSGMYAGRGPPPPVARPLPVAPGGALVVASEPALANLLAAEIGRLAGRHPEPLAVAAVRAGAARTAGRHVLATRDCLADLYGLPEDQRPSTATPLPIDPLHHLRDFVLRLRAPATVGVVTASDKVRDLVSAGIWRLRGEEVAVCAYTVPCPIHARRNLELADLVLADPGVLDRVPKPRSSSSGPRAPLLLISFGETGFPGFRNLLHPVR